MRLGRTDKHPVGYLKEQPLPVLPVVVFPVPGMTWPPIPTVLQCWWRALMVVGWSLVENYTVDASILFSVFKLSRANGGCLGTRSR